MKQQTRLKGIRDLYETYGDTFETNSFGSTIINTIDPANIQTFLSLEFSRYVLEPIRFPVASPIMGHSIFTTDGHLWEKARSEIKPVFARGEISNMASLEWHLDKMIKRLPLDGSLFDIAPFVDNLYLADSLDYLFAQSIIFPKTDLSSLNVRFLKCFRASTAGAGRRHFFGRLRYVIPDLPFRQACKELHEFADMHINAALGYLHQDSDSSAELKTGRSAFLLDLARQTQDKRYLRNQLLAVFMAGHDSIAVLVEDAIYELARHPEVWSRARAEALALAGKPLTFESVRSQQYLYQIIKEVLRLHPLSPTSSRIAVEPTILPRGGKGNRPLLVPAGATVMVHRQPLHVNKERYGEDADEFRPQRWQKLKQGWHYMPFSGGPRTCPAQAMAMAEAAAVLTRLLQEVEKIKGEGEWKEGWGLVVRNVAGVWVRLTPSQEY
ncbi:cytochrome P450 [Viridothelium virens]|uniref:Cytochrome P450 n=1 Tax=Viridothelium virens TaxID=1048519 RepID=A0A6A6GTR4_VIRVR|nr:cytochrome P450 [Viridothelium virens]